MLRVKNIHPGSPSDPSVTAVAEAKPSYVKVLDFKTTWSEFQKTNQTATKQGSAEKISHQNLSLLTSPESVPSSCVREHT